MNLKEKIKNTKLFSDKEKLELLVKFDDLSEDTVEKNREDYR